MDWLPLLSQPLSLAGIVGFLMVLHKLGLVDLRRAVQNFIGFNGTTAEVDANNRNVAQELLSKMELLFGEQKSLKEYYNHSTTDALDRLAAGQVELRTTQLVQCQKLDQHIRQNDQMIDSLKSIEREVIKMAK